MGQIILRVGQEVVPGICGLYACPRALRSNVKLRDYVNLQSGPGFLEEAKARPDVDHGNCVDVSIYRAHVDVWMSAQPPPVMTLVPVGVLLWILKKLPPPGFEPGSLGDTTSFRLGAMRAEYPRPTRLQRNHLERGWKQTSTADPHRGQDSRPNSRCCPTKTPHEKNRTPGQRGTQGKAKL